MKASEMIDKLIKEKNDMEVRKDGVDALATSASVTNKTANWNINSNSSYLTLGNWHTDGCNWAMINTKTDNREKEVSEEVNTKLEITNKTIFVKYYEDGYFKYQKDIMPDIKDVIIYNNTVIVTFADNTKTKAVLNREDAFNLEQGISICITKKLLGKHGDGIYNKIMNRALKIKKLNEEAKIKDEEERQREKVRKEKAAARKQRRDAKRREAEIEMRKEAYVRAIKELEGKN